MMLITIPCWLIPAVSATFKNPDSDCRLSLSLSLSKGRRKNALSVVQRRSGFGPTPSPIEPNFRRLTTIECEKDTPVDGSGKRS